MGKHLHEVMGWAGPMTHRQFEAWNEWLDQQWNEPDRTDHYLMRMTADFRQANSKKGTRVDPNGLKIKFRKQGAAANKVSQETAKAMWKASWQARLGQIGNAEQDRKKNRKE